jgi:anti-sigma regulatory factor (Ser/Thr protein kinase)/DNA-binding transcriptional ArsR family regulator
MTKRIRARGEDVRKYVLQHLEKHPHDLTKVVAEHFGITRQAVSKHLQRLSAEHAIVESGQTRNRTYKLATLAEWDRAYEITPTLAEDLVWRDDVSKVIGDMPDNVLAIWHYGFTEIFNNALDHSAGTTIYLAIRRNAVDTEMIVKDNGVGIFKKIQTELGLLDERHAILELAKGKLTTDPKRHTGEGIFFSSRMFDQFDILSGTVFFTHKFEDTGDWILERNKLGTAGTFVWMKLNNHTSRTTTEIFDQYSSGDEYGFTKTVVPVNLARYGNENLISRSQAKRLLARVELFKKVLFDFSDVPIIGQAFADEIFRVFATSHPDIDLVPIHANSEVKRMIDRARFAGSQGPEKTS